MDDQYIFYCRRIFGGHLRGGGQFYYFQHFRRWFEVTGTTSHQFEFRQALNGLKDFNGHNFADAVSQFNQQMIRAISSLICFRLICFCRGV